MERRYNGFKFYDSPEITPTERVLADAGLTAGIIVGAYAGIIVNYAVGDVVGRYFAAKEQAFQQAQAPLTERKASKYSSIDPIIDRNDISNESLSGYAHRQTGLKKEL